MKRASSPKKPVVFIVPPYSEEVWSVSEKVVYYSVANLGALLRRHGHDVRVFDCQVDYFHLSDLLSAVEKHAEVAPAFFGIPVIFGSTRNAYLIANGVRRLFADTPIVMGGLPATFAYERILKECPAVDVCVVGEGEAVALALLKERDWRGVPGIAYREGGRIVKNPPSASAIDIDRLPPPDYSLFNVRNYAGLLSYETSRGCPYSCEFCLQGVKEGRRLREKSVGKVVEELKAASRFGWAIMIVDNDFLTDLPRAKEILRQIIKHRLNESMIFGIATRVSNFLRSTDELLDLCRRANVLGLYFGIESLAKKKRAEIGKIRDLQELKELFRLIEKKGLLYLPSYIMGFPDEGREDIDETLEQAIRLNSPMIKLNIFTPFPGTGSHEELSKQGLIDHAVPLNSYDNVHQVFRHPLDLEAVYRDFIKRYYVRDTYLKRGGDPDANSRMMERKYLEKIEMEKRKKMMGVDDREFVRDDGLRTASGFGGSGTPALWS
ncbi:MAG: radical SAM protein [Elusimicrobiota bacterium]